MKQNAIAILILAAGSSARLGTAKQLLPFKETTLLQHTVREALGAGCKLLVVTGANAAAISEDLEKTHTPCVFNEYWQKGMGASIKKGLLHLLLLHPALQAVIIAVCDQPAVSEALLQNLISLHHASGKNIVACSYAGTAGTPALFAKSFFPHLLQLPDDAGAKAVLKQNASHLALLPFADGRIDIDTPEDYEALFSGNID